MSHEDIAEVEPQRKKAVNDVNKKGSKNNFI